eukprot:s1289_g8.t1
MWNVGQKFAETGARIPSDLRRTPSWVSSLMRSQAHWVYGYNVFGNPAHPAGQEGTSGGQEQVDEFTCFHV